MDDFILQLPRFEGPLDLLLYLIDKNRFTLSELEVCPIIDQYLDYVARAQAMDMNLASEFLEMSSYLIWLKSCVLLPPAPETEAGDEGPDPVTELKELLLQYRAVKLAGQDLGQRQTLYRDSFPRGTTEIEPGVALTGVAALMQALQLIKNRTRQHVIVKTVSRLNIREVMGRVALVLERRRKAELVSLAEGGGRAELIAVFLAALELSKVRLAALVQKGLFRRIVLIRRPSVEGACE